MRSLNLGDFHFLSLEKRGNGGGGRGAGWLQEGEVNPRERGNKPTGGRKQTAGSLRVPKAAGSGRNILFKKRAHST